MSEALETSQDLRAAAARIEIARADAKIAGAPLLPAAEVGVSRVDQRQNFIGLPIPGYEDAVLNSTSTSYGLRVGASWEPDFWGRIREGQFAAVSDVRQRYSELAAARLSLSGQVGRAWFSLAEYLGQLDLAQSSLKSFRMSEEIVNARFQAGLRPAADLRMARAETARAEGVVAQREEQISRAVRNLETLLGRYPSGKLTVGGGLADLPPAIPGGLPSELVHRRPDLAAAETAVASAHAREVQSMKELRPHFSLTSGSGTSSTQLLDLLNARLFIWSFVASVAQPIFDNGRRRAVADRTGSQTDLLVANYESLLLRAYGEVESALAAESILASRARAMGRAAEEARAAQQLVREQYRSGLTDTFTLLSAQRTAEGAESQLLNVRHLRLDNRVLLHLALGGGFNLDEIPAASEILRK